MINVKNKIEMISLENPNTKPNLMAIIISMESMVTRNQIATRKRKNKVEKELKKSNNFKGKKKNNKIAFVYGLYSGLTLS